MHKMAGSNQATNTLLLATAAVGAGFTGTAQAAVISKAPAGFTPVIISANTSPYSFDVDGNGTKDFTIASASISRGTITALTNGYGIDTNASKATAYIRPASFPASANLSSTTNIFASVPPSGKAASNFNSTVLYGDVVVTSPTGTVQGYFAGTFDPASNISIAAIVPGTSAPASTVPSFTLTDFGIVTASTAVPEPGSLALLATGAAGIGLLRRRRATRAA